MPRSTLGYFWTPRRPQKTPPGEPGGGAGDPQETPEDPQETPEEPQEIPEELQGTPEELQGTPKELQGTPGELQKNLRRLAKASKPWKASEQLAELQETPGRIQKTRPRASESQNLYTKLSIGSETPDTSPLATRMLSYGIIWYHMISCDVI